MAGSRCEAPGERPPKGGEKERAAWHGRNPDQGPAPPARIRDFSPFFPPFLFIAARGTGLGPVGAGSSLRKKD